MSKLIGWFDENSVVWCYLHKPEPNKYKGELTDLKSSDSWLYEIGPCCICDRIMDELSSVQH